MKKLLASVLLLTVLFLNSPVFAGATNSYKAKAHKAYKKVESTSETHGKNGVVTPKSIGAGALSLIVWPGIGQLMNDEKNTDKVLVHALLGFTGVFRIWSCYDGVVDRKGGVWNNRI